MKKNFIIPALAVMLAVSCSNSGKPGKDKTVKFKFEEAISFYSEQGVENVSLAEYVSKNLEATSEYVTDYVETTGLLEARIYGSSKEEMDSFAEKCESLGWVLTQDEYEDYSGTFGNSLAEITIADWTKEEDYECIRIGFSVQSAVWPKGQISKYFQLFEETEYEVPALVAANGRFVASIYSQYGFSADGVLVTVNGATAEEISTYLTTTLPQGGWNVASGIATKAFEELDGVATIAYAEQDNAFVVVLWFGLSPIPQEGFPSEAIAAAFKALEVQAFEIPAPASEGHTYEYKFDDSNIEYKDYPNYCYDTMYINNMSENQFNAYRELLGTNGWTTSSEEQPFMYQKHFDAGFTASIKLSWHSDESYGEYCALTIYYIVTADPEPEPEPQPGDVTINGKAAAKYAAAGLTVTLPDFSSFDQFIASSEENDYGVYFHLTGDHVSDILAVMASSFDVPSTPDADFGYICAYKDNSDIVVTVGYSESEDKTVLSFYVPEL